jgi:DNA glycosylase AlkZ-like
LNRATLARQLLLRRSGLAVSRAVERLSAMQAQSAREAYIGLWSRLKRFERDALTRALERRRVVRASLFRITLHYVSATNHPAFAALTHQRWREEFLREGHPVDDMVARIERLAARGTFTYADAAAVVPELESRPFRVRCLTPLVHVPPSGTWGGIRVRLTTAERWLGAAMPSQPEAAALLVKSYLGAFGPATRQDLVKFSGLRGVDVKPGLDALDEQLLRFRDEQDRELFDLRRAPRPGAETPVPVRFLPKWDALLLSHADRTRVLPPEYHREVIKAGYVFSSFLVDGMVAGLWKAERRRVKLEPFAPLPRSIRREAEDEAGRLRAFLA